MSPDQSQQREQPLPEDIRGGWYYLPEDMPVEKVGAKKGADLLAFRLDGSFVRYAVESGARTETEEGGYTFDGNFLILRGGSTKTYRVDSSVPWRWNLEGKKKNRVLLRGLYGDSQPVRVADSRRQAIAESPGRVKVRTPFDGPDRDEILSLFHRDADHDEQRVGACFVESGDDGVAWAALTPFVQGVEAATWEKVFRDSCLPAVSKGPDDVELKIVG